MFDPLVAEVRQPGEGAPLQGLDVAAFAARLFDLGAPPASLLLAALLCCTLNSMYCTALRRPACPGGNYLRGAPLAGHAADALLTANRKAYQLAELRARADGLNTSATPLPSPPTSRGSLPPPL